MKTEYRFFTLLSAMAGYLELGVLVYLYQDRNSGMLGILDFFIGVLVAGIINLLFLVGVYFEKRYAAKRMLAGWHVPSISIVPGLILNGLIMMGGCVLLGIVVYCMIF